MSSTRILLLGAAALLLYLALPSALRAGFACRAVGYETAVTGRVSGHWQSRHAHGFFLDGRRRPSYDFRAFVPAPAAAPADEQDLNQYLRPGDLIRKPAHARALTVRRGDRLSHWVCPPAEATP
ncbi:hypothetical protein Q3A66_19020 [Hymenobacter sp. BT770]|uniref:hypothetical protein n=1 Tax=Hymenobacter sp. BT770 TaxID=2886942 RepID=UPI001D118518|nr:hypothetical protein [Hymenobacter sp. BT770]MCC3155210.1 hypothetical protein [Hymenobacter sp. BT770]MDO3417165.1 hypothetical protein [Hymenobacter sp. BT770]